MWHGQDRTDTRRRLRPPGRHGRGRRNRLARLARGVAGGGARGASGKRDRRGEDPAPGQPAEPVAHQFLLFFKDRAAILDALLEDWEATNTRALIAACEAYADTIAEAVLNVIGVFLDETRFEPRFDFAVRGWAHRSDAVMARVTAADEARLDAIRAMFRRFGFDPDEADVRARTVYLVQIGYIALQTRESLATRMARIPAYVKTYSGQPPDARELARFHARFGFDAKAAEDRARA